MLVLRMLVLLAHACPPPLLHLVSLATSRRSSESSSASRSPASSRATTACRPSAWLLLTYLPF